MSTKDIRGNGYIYVVQASNKTKIGWSRDPKKRALSYRGYKKAVVFSQEISCALELEFHKKMGSPNEWYSLKFETAVEHVKTWLKLQNLSCEMQMLENVKPIGRPLLGQPISLTVSDEMREWIDSKIVPGGTRTEVIRKIVNDAMKRDQKKEK